MLLPDARRRGEIQFVLARSLPYSRRMALIAVLLAGGLAVQVLVSVWAGAALLLAASLLAIVQGFSNIPEDLAGPREWRGAERGQLENILRLDRKSRSWDISLIDVTCGQGAVAFLLIAAVTSVAAYALSISYHEWLAKALVLDVCALLVPHWITGVRRILTNDPLTVKVRQLLSVVNCWEAIRIEGEVMAPQMTVIRGPKGEMPCDAKLVLRLEPLGEKFLGVQVQVVLNRVQGKDYPYTYCVLVARPQLKMLQRLRLTPPAGIVVEPKRQGDVDILVVRNRTTKTSGYHTPPMISRAIFQYALQQARSLLAE
jgi:hypothetical protein